MPLAVRRRDDQDQDPGEGDAVVTVGWLRLVIGSGEVKKKGDGVRP